MVVGDIMEPFFGALIRTVTRRLSSRGYALIFTENEYSSDLELSSLKILHGHRVSGVILRSGFGPPNLEYLEAIHRSGTKILHIDYFFPDSPFGYVMLDNQRSVEEGVSYLRSLGHTRIAALATHDPVKAPEERSKAFESAMHRVGLSVVPEYQRVVSLVEPEEVYQFTLDLMRLPNPPTALFALNGNQGQTAYRALRDAGLRIPHDVSLLTFDTYPWMTLVEPGLDSIEQPVVEMGNTVVDQLLEQIEGAPTIEPVRIRLPGQLQKRGSCGRVDS